MICPVCGNPNAGRRHGFAFEDEFYCGDCQKSYKEYEWYKLRSIMMAEALEMWSKNKQGEQKKIRK